jgi:hypothetical protein
VPAISGPFVIAGALLALAAAQKLLDPRNTVGALRALGLPSRPLIVRAGAAGELAIGASALTVAHPAPAVLVALSYVAFAGFVLAALRKGAMIGTCGCLGRAETPPSAVHVVVDIVFAVVASVWAVGYADAAPLAGLGDAPGGGAPFVMLAALGLGLVYVALTELPRVSHASG